MPIQLFNTLNKQKDIFKPINDDHVKFYVCGPTVYDKAHIGNARPVVVFDTLFRLLKNQFPKTTYVRNITDVEDKISARAKELNISIEDLTRKTTEIYHQDMDSLFALRPTVEPRATDHILEMIDMIEHLIKNHNAYEAQGHVLFDVTSKKDYGKLSNRTLDEMIAGARVEVAPYKKNPSDFVLWKPSDADQPGWESPWGRGRPGWHIECSAMSKKHLGTHFDIHGGGQDLIFPHHENEIAQSECANGTPHFANYWMHNGYVIVDGEKMSKSLGNFITVHDLLDEFPGEAIRLTLLKTHYRQPLNFTKQSCSESKALLDRLYTALKDYDLDLNNNKNHTPSSKVIDALMDDLNTPLALSHLSELVHQLNKENDQKVKTEIAQTLLSSGSILGLLNHKPNDWFQSSDNQDSLSAEKIHELIAKRNNARAEKQFSQADEIRDYLKKHGVILEDNPSGTDWKRVS